MLLPKLRGFVIYAGGACRVSSSVGGQGNGSSGHLGAWLKLQIATSNVQFLCHFDLETRCIVSTLARIQVL